MHFDFAIVVIATILLFTDKQSVLELIMNTHESYVSLEMAKLLKEAGIKKVLELILDKR